MVIEVYSDVICPWCYIGRRRLEKALAEADVTDVRVVWRAYELNPDMPPGGISRAEYRTRKFGSLERSRELDARVTAAAVAEGLPIDFDQIERTPNTFDAHRLIWLAGQDPSTEGLQDHLAGALFHAYFAEGLDVGAAEVLSRIAGECGLDTARVDAFLASKEGTTEVLEQEAHARALGIDSVPTFVLDGRYVITGAQPAPLLADAIRQVLAVTLA